jgi:hypothetical protein
MARTIHRDTPIGALVQTSIIAVQATAITLCFSSLFHPAWSQGSECTSLLNEKTRAMNARPLDHKRIIKAARTLLDFCQRQLIEMDSYGGHLSDLALSLANDNQPGEAAAVAERCLQRKIDNRLACMLAKGAALFGMERFEDARRALTQAMAEPALTTTDEASK